MGCCASSNFKATSAYQKHRHCSASRSDVSLHSRAAPPPPPPPPSPPLPPEEETVKEVLSETPAAKPPVPKIEDEDMKRVSSSRPALNKIHEEEEKNDEKKTPLMMTTEEVSEVSEICSLSESVSTVTEKREDEDREVSQRLDRSPAKFRNLAFSSDRNVRAATTGKSPARRFEPSPGRARSVSGKERRPAANGRRWDSGESSGRRSRSPATRAAEGGGARAGRGRSPSAGKTGKSPGRFMTEPPEKTRKIEEVNKEIAKRSPPTANESLENPLVSLECFIFL